MGLSKSDAIRLTRSMRTLDFTAQLGGVACPVAVLYGEKDGANLRALKELGARLPNAALQIVPGAGHAVNKDAPEAIAAALNSRT